RRRHVTGRADKSSFLILGPDLGGESDVGELRLSVYEDNILRLDVAMGESIAMKKLQRVGERESDPQAFPHRQPASARAGADTDQVARLVGRRRAFPIRIERIAQ